MLGSHLSVAGGLVNALIEAKRLKMQTVQIFTKNQRQWNAKPLDPDVVQAWLSDLHELGWQHTVSHASYLINLATSDDEHHQKSVDAMTDEIERCETLEVPFCVVHPGSHKGFGEEVGIKRIIKGLNKVIANTKGYNTRICLENTAGGGNLLGGDFAHLGHAKQGVKTPERVGYCFDTCHAAVMGYDMTTIEKAATVLQQFDDDAGLDHLLCFHLNDSKDPIGSHRDRHNHIGDGHVGKTAFEYILNCTRFEGVPMILETPKGETDKGTPWDRVNLQRLKRLIVK